jgi:hypothetical protein
MNQTVMHNLGVVDTLGVAPGLDTVTIANVADSVTVAEVSAEEMFGTQSHIVSNLVQVEPSQTLVGDVVFQILAVVMMLVVVLFIARNRRSIFSMFARMFKGRLSDDFASGRRDEVLTRSFIHTSALIGVMLITLFGAKYAPMWLPETLTPDAGWVSTIAVIYILIGIAAISAFEYSLLWLVGKVTRGEEAVGAIIYMKRMSFALASIAMSPIFLFGVLSSEKLTESWNIVLFVECLILVFMYIKETLVFFVDKKIPIFHWILYLCTVEAFPLSLIWAQTVRS